MAKPLEGMEARPDQSEQTPPTEDIKRVLQLHREALIIVADPDTGYEGESKIAVFSKLLDEDGVLSPMLVNVLQNLLATSDGKQCSSVSDQTATGAETHNSADSEHRENCRPAVQG